MRGLLREEQTGGWLASLPSKATMHLCLSAATAHLCLCCQSTFVQRHGSVPPLVCLTMPHNGGECPAAPHCPVEVGVGSKARKWPGACRHPPDQAFSQAETTESLLSEGPLGLRHERDRARSPWNWRGLCRWVMSRP